MRMIFGGSSGGYYIPKNNLLRDCNSTSLTLNGAERLVRVQNQDNHHFLWNFPFDVTNLILGTISPSLAMNKHDERHDNKTWSNNYHTALKHERQDNNNNKWFQLNKIVPINHDASSISLLSNFLDSSNSSIFYNVDSFISTVEDFEEIPQFSLILHEIHPLFCKIHSNVPRAVYNLKNGLLDGFQNILEGLVESSLKLASLGEDKEEQTNKQSPWMLDRNTTKVLTHQHNKHYTHNERTNILKNNVLKWTGTTETHSTTNITCQSHAYPILKTQGIVSMATERTPLWSQPCQRIQQTLPQQKEHLHPPISQPQQNHCHSRTHHASPHSRRIHPDIGADSFLSHPLQGCRMQMQCRVHICLLFCEGKIGRGGEGSVLFD